MSSRILSYRHHKLAKLDNKPKTGQQRYQQAYRPSHGSSIVVVVELVACSRFARVYTSNWLNMLPLDWLVQRIHLDCSTGNSDTEVSVFSFDMQFFKRQLRRESVPLQRGMCPLRENPGPVTVHIITIYLWLRFLM